MCPACGGGRCDGAECNVFAALGPGLATAGPASAAEGAWRVYGNTNPITLCPGVPKRPERCSGGELSSPSLRASPACVGGIGVSATEVARVHRVCVPPVLG
ncbi:hypothetical protein GCM10017667_69550 [Streptomyces filamentosus]|uniref:Uncharacterized protein n=1 Tax=Streptomyces filamentosus TaxID=67294 RepID=A0A919BXZ1_STRFL|nr:hypothetical protein GCM10017667_69550 [Streptomyces filamentosus]